MKLIAVVLMLLISVSVLAEGKKASAESKEKIILTKDNTAVLFGVVDGSSVSDVMQQVQKLNSALPSGYPINLFLYTPGGSIQDGLELIEYLKTLNRPVNTITSFSASMGFQIVQSLNKRYILDTGVLMSHKAAGGFEGEFGDGMSQIDSRYGLWMERILQMDQKTVERTNGKQTLKTYRAAYQNEMWRTGSRSVSEGYADQVVQVSCGKDLVGTRDQTFDFMGLTIHVSFSECPLNTNPIAISVELPTNKGTMTHKDFLAKGGVFLKDKKELGSSYYDPELYCTDPPNGMADLKNKLVEIKKEVIARQRRVVKSY